MRQVVAALVDVVGTGITGFAGFFVAYRVTPCTDVSECPILTPVVLVTIVVCVGAYFVIGYRLLGATPGQRLAHTTKDAGSAPVDTDSPNRT